jgi:hypothetical protein
MTKAEVKEALKKAGKFDTNSRDQLWIDAFKAFEQETKMKLSLSCGSCFSKVREWLNS